MPQKVRNLYPQCRKTNGVFTVRDENISVEDWPVAIYRECPPFVLGEIVALIESSSIDLAHVMASSETLLRLCREMIYASEPRRALAIEEAKCLIELLDRAVPPNELKETSCLK